MAFSLTNKLPETTKYEGPAWSFGRMVSLLVKGVLGGVALGVGIAGISTLLAPATITMSAALSSWVPLTTLIGGVAGLVISLTGEEDK